MNSKSTQERPLLIEHELANGLRVLLAPVPRAPATALMLGYPVGSICEGAGWTGVSHFLEHMLFKTTRRLKVGEVSRITRANGGYDDAFTSVENTVYLFWLPLDRWPVALAIEAQRLREVVFEPGEFEAERAVVLEECLLARDDPAEALRDRLIAAAFGDHPLAHPILGSPADLLALTPERLQAYYDLHYRPRSAVLVASGGFDPERMLAEIKRRLGPVPAGPEPPPAPAPARFQARPRPIELRRPGAPPLVMAAYPVPGGLHPDLPALQALAAIAAGGRASRLHRALVEETALATSVGVGLWRTRAGLPLFVHAELRPGADPAAALARLESELAELAASGPTQEEIERARRRRSARLRLRLEHGLGRGELLVEAALMGQPELPWRELAAMERLDGQALAAAARRWLDPERRVAGWVVPGQPEESAPEVAVPTVPKRPPLAPGRRRPVAPLAPARRGPPPAVRLRAASGLECLLAPRPAGGLASVRLTLDAGSGLDPDGGAGLAALTAAALARGTAAYGERALAELLESQGIEYAAHAGRQSTTLAFDLPAEELPLALQLAAELALRPRLAPEEVERERARLAAELTADEESPAGAARRRFFWLAGGGRPEARPAEGWPDELARLRPEQAAAFRAATYRPERARLTVAGDFDPQATAAAARACFERWPSPAGGPPGTSAAGPAPTRRRVGRRLLHRLPREQTYLILGAPVPGRTGRSHAALLVLAKLLDHRLIENLRERSGLAYYLQVLGEGIDDRTAGVLCARLVTAMANTRPALAGMAAELDRARRRPAGREELARARNMAAGELIYRSEPLAGWTDELATASRLGLPLDARERLLAALAAVGAAGVQRAAERFLAPARLRLAAAGAIDEAALAAAGFADR